MSHVSQWLDARAPLQPRVLADDLRADVVACGDDIDVVECICGSALSRLSRARGRLGRVRASAFDLLAADALVTYACEAALEVEDPEAALTDLLGAVAAP